MQIVERCFNTIHYCFVRTSVREVWEQIQFLPLEIYHGGTNGRDLVTVRYFQFLTEGAGTASPLVDISQLKVWRDCLHYNHQLDHDLSVMRKPWDTFHIEEAVRDRNIWQIFYCEGPKKIFAKTMLLRFVFRIGHVTSRFASQVSAVGYFSYWGSCPWSKHLTDFLPVRDQSIYMQKPCYFDLFFEFDT